MMVWVVNRIIDHTYFRIRLAKFGNGELPLEYHTEFSHDIYRCSIGDLCDGDNAWEPKHREPVVKRRARSFGCQPSPPAIPRQPPADLHLATVPQILQPAHAD